MQEKRKSDAELVGKRFGEHVKTRREDRGLSQRQLADLLGEVGLPLDPSAITRIERGTRDVKLYEALALSEVLDFDLNALRPAEDSALFFAASDRLKRSIMLARKALYGLLADYQAIFDLVETNPKVLPPPSTTLDEFVQGHISGLNKLQGISGQRIVTDRHRAGQLRELLRAVPAGMVVSDEPKA